jgi:hypothetical protein
MKPFRYPELDNRLPGYAQPLGFPVEFPDHPYREVYANPLGFKPWALCFVQIQIFNDIIPLIKRSVKFFSR